MDAEICARVGVRPVHDFRIPGRRHHNACRRYPTVFKRSRNGAIDGMRHAEVVSMDNQQPRLWRIAKPLLHRLVLLCSNGGCESYTDNRKRDPAEFQIQVRCWS